MLTSQCKGTAHSGTQIVSGSPYGYECMPYCLATALTIAILA